MNDYGMIRTFGYEREGIAVTRVPVGLLCSWCGEAIAAGDWGIWMLHCRELGDSFRPIHGECNLRTIVGSLEHQRREKEGLPCDPEGACSEDTNLSRRANAILAYRYFRNQRVN